MADRSASQQGLSPDRRSVPDIAHQINDDACGGNIEPDGDRPFRHALVASITMTKRWHHGHDDHRQIQNRQRDMREQNGEIDWPRPTSARKFHMPGMVVIIEVAA